VQCLALTIDELKKHYNADLQRIAEVLSVEKSTAIAIMRHYDWYAPFLSDFACKAVMATTSKA
jgi:hypothetical protein